MKRTTYNQARLQTEGGLFLMSACVTEQSERNTEHELIPQTRAKRALRDHNLGNACVTEQSERNTEPEIISIRQVL